MILRKSRKLILYIFLLANFIPQAKSSLFRKVDNNTNIQYDKINWSEFTQNSYDFGPTIFKKQNLEKYKKFSKAKNFFLLKHTKSASKAINFAKDDVKNYSNGIPHPSQVDAKEFLRKNINSVKDKSEKTLVSPNNEKELIIQSKKQSEKNNILSAEGDVLVSYRGNFLKKRLKTLGIR